MTGRLRVWTAWVGANSISELVGLSLVFATGAVAFRVWGEPRTAVARMAFLALAGALGIVEGMIVGWAQAIVLRRVLPNIAGKSWVAATSIGAFVAWTLGMLPNLFRSGSPDQGEMPTGPEIMLIAALMGLAAGCILAVAQWRVLRQYAVNASWWLPANAAAWALGMPWIFWLVDHTVGGSQSAASVTGFIVGLAGAGAIVGAVHGAVVVTLRPRPGRT